jgi:hypothetical protein
MMGWEECRSIGCVTQLIDHNGLIGNDMNRASQTVRTIQPDSEGLLFTSV